LALLSRSSGVPRATRVSPLGYRRSFPDLARALHVLFKTQEFQRGSPRRTSVRVNRRSKPARSIRYVLSADRKLQRLSLRRISVPAKKTRKAGKATRSIRPAIRPKSLAPITDAKAVRALTPRAVFAGAICVMAAAVLIAARQPSQLPEVSSISAPPTVILPEEIALPKPSAPPVAAALSAASVSTEPAASPARPET